MTQPAWKRKLGELFGIDPRALAAFRIGLALIVLVDLLVLRSTTFAASYTDAGVLPRRLLTGGVEESFFPFHMWSGSLAWQLCLALLLGVAALLLLVGLRTRIASVVCFLLVASLQVRNPFVLNYGDELLRTLLFWGMFLPLGRSASLDARRARGGSDPRALVLSPGSAALLLQVFLVYFCTGLLKNGSDWWTDASAVWYTLNADWWVRPLGVALREHTDALALVARATLVLELVGPWLLFAPVATRWLRGAAVLAFALFQLGLGISMLLGLFPWVNGVALLPFLPSALWDHVGFARGSRWPRPAVASDSARPGRRAARGWGGRVADGLAGVALLYVLIANANSVRPLVPLPDWLTQLGYDLRLNQRWAMYSPNVPRADGWYVMPGQLASGRQVDLSGRGPELRWGKPEHLAASHVSFRWARYLWQLRNEDTNQILRRRLARWLCQQWNGTHPGESERLESLQIFFVSEETPPVHGHPVIERRFLLRHDCRAPREP